MQKLKKIKISPFRLSSLLRLEKDPKLALQLFLKPDPEDPDPNPKPFRHSLLCYDLVISKLGRARMIPEMETVVEKLKNDARIKPEEIILCNVITFYARARLPCKALEVFDEIPSFRCRRTIKSANTLLNALLVCREFDKMIEFFSGIDNYGSPDACTYNILINACCARSDLETAWKVFDEMPVRGIEPNVVTFGTLINGLRSNSELDKAIGLKGRMEREFSKIKPNAHIYISLIKGLCEVNRLSEAVELKEEMLRNEVKLDPAVYSTLISAFLKARRKNEASGFLEEMKWHGCKPDTVTFNVMIHGFCREKDIDSAFRTLGDMEKEGCKPHVTSYNVIIIALCREKRLNEANDLFEDMPRRKCRPDLVTYRTIFDGFCDAKRFKEASGILDEMIFLGYVYNSSSVSKYIDELVVRRENKELWACLFQLAKTNSIDRYVWRLVTSLVCEDGRSDAHALFDRLTNCSSMH